MKVALEIRPMRIDDLREVFILGKELLNACAGWPPPWNEASLAETIAGCLETSFVAVYKRKVAGFLIGSAVSGAPAACVIWLASRHFEGIDVTGDLFLSFRRIAMEKNIGRIQINTPRSRPDLIAFCEKFGFTSSEEVLMMENFLPKNKE
jgi:hypothetical protein